MKKLLSLILTLSILTLGGCKTPEQPDAERPGGGVGDAPIECTSHADTNSDLVCDFCRCSVLTVIDFYSVNDLHGKLDDADTHPGVDELSTYLKAMREADDHAIILSCGDMWQGSPESNATSGYVITDWMNALDFAAMTVGNHEFDWGEEALLANGELADFPLLAINIFERQTNERVDYAKASVTVECGEVTVGIIGAIGDCYSSISPDKVEDVYFVVDYRLTELVMAEADRLRSEGADIIVYMLHDGFGRSSYGDGDISATELDSYYDIALSDGYVDLVFEAHTHQSYVLHDRYGVYHLQGGGDNEGITHAELILNTVTGDVSTSEAEFVSTSAYASMNDDPVIDELLEKYHEEISGTTEVLGRSSRYLSSGAVADLVARLYYDFGVEKWGDSYGIVLGGGFIKTRSPYDLEAGDITYAELWSILPFDNQLTLCSVKGSDLLSKFINTSNSSYHIYPETHSGIDKDKTYYIVTDSYTAYYTPNRLTVIEEYSDPVYARDLLAEYVKSGGLE